MRRFHRGRPVGRRPLAAKATFMPCGVFAVLGE
jgi:hypothetical protein